MLLLQKLFYHYFNNKILLCHKHNNGKNTTANIISMYTASISQVHQTKYPRMPQHTADKRSKVLFTAASSEDYFTGVL